MQYSSREMMTIAAAREIEDGSTVFCCTGLSMLAAIAAKKITAPNSVIFFETGAIDSRLEEIPMAVADPRVMYQACTNTSMLDAFAFMQNRITGENVIGILGAAQIDPYGNLNTTCIGDYHTPAVRFPGSGGGCDVTSFVPRSIIFMQQESRKFVEKLDYMTSPGYLSGGDSRAAAGLPAGGPGAVVTNMGILRFEPDSKRMYLSGCYQGVTPEMIAARTGFSLETSKAGTVPPPSPEELDILRNRCDPQRLICN